MKQKNQAEFHCSGILTVRLVPHRWVPCNEMELAVMCGDFRIMTDYGTAVLDTSTLRVDLGATNGSRSLLDHLSRKVSEAVARDIGDRTFTLHVVEQDDRHVRFTLEPISGNVRELRLPKYFETSPLMLSRALQASAAPAAGNEEEEAHTAMVA